jgi:hypothetical protein
MYTHSVTRRTKTEEVSTRCTSCFVTIGSSFDRGGFRTTSGSVDSTPLLTLKYVSDDTS